MKLRSSTPSSIVIVILVLALAGRALAGTPTVTLAQVGATSHYGAGDTLTVTATFSEAVGATGSGADDFAEDDLTLSGCSVDSGGFVESTADTVWTITLTPDGTGSCTIDVDAAVADSTSTGTDNTAASQLAIAFKALPTITSASADGAAPSSSHDNGDVTLTITFSHAVTNFVVGDITVSHGSLSSFSGSGTSYTVTLDPTGGTDGTNGDITVDVAAGVADHGGTSTTNAAATQLTLAYGPSVSISAASGDHDGATAVVLTVTLSEGISDGEFIDADWTASGCTVSDTTKVTATSYTANATPGDTGTCTISVAANKFTGATSTDGNLATASDTNIYYGIPSVSVSTTDDNVGTHDSSTAINIQVTFGAPVGTTGDGSNDFVVGDITATGCTLADFTEATGSNADKVWTLTATPSSTANCVIYVPSSKATGINGGLWNTASNVLTFRYTTQWGLVSVSNIEADATRGTTPGTVSVSGSTTTVSLANYKYKAEIGTDNQNGVKICLDRSADDSLSSSSLDGSMTIRLTLESGITDVFINADEDDGATGTSTEKFNQKLADGAMADGGTFDLKWGDAETGDRCFFIHRTAWVSSGGQGCPVSAASYDFTIDAVDVEADSECTSGGDTSECGTNSRYFTNAMSTISIARTRDVHPTLKVLAVEDMVALFAAGDAPPDFNTPMYAQDEPTRLLVFQRECILDYGTATDSVGSMLGDVVVDLEAMLLDVTGNTGIKSGSNYEFFDVSGNYVNTATTWTTMGETLGNAVTSITWDGSTCGAANSVYILVRFHDGDGSAALDAAEQATFSLTETGAVLTSSSSSCPSTHITTQDPAITFIIWNDPTRDDTVFDTGASTDPIDLRFFVGTPALSGSDFTVDVAQRYHLSTEDSKKALRFVGLGNGIPKTGAAYRFLPSTLASMCTSLPENFESQVVTGAVTANSLHDALFVDGSYYSTATDTLWFGGEDVADDDAGNDKDSAQDLDFNAYPFYPSNGVSGSVVSPSWQALAASNTGSDLCYFGPSESTSGKFCAKHSIAGTLSQLRDCKNADGSDVLSISNDEDAGTTTYTLTVFSQAISYRGTDPDDRDWEELQLVTKTLSFSFDTGLVASISAESLDINVDVDLLTVESESCVAADCSYGGNMDIPSDHACNCGGSCPSTAVFQRLLFTVMADVDRTGHGETSGDIGIRDTNHVAFAAADQSSSSHTCYGLETSAALSSVLFVDDHDSSSTKNRFVLTFRTKCVNTYSQMASANADNTFVSCEDESYKDNFDFKVYLSEVTTAGMSWGAALSQRLGDSYFRDSGVVPIAMRTHFTGPVATASIGTGETAAFTATSLSMYLDPDYQDEGSWLQETSVSALTADAGGPISILETGRIILAHELTHAATKDVLTLHIKEAHACTLNPRSKYYNCLHPESTSPASDTGYGAVVTQVACPTGANADLQYSCDINAWSEFIGASPSGTNISPVSNSYDFVRNYKATTPWSGETGAETAFLCRYNVKSAAQKNRPGTTNFFCDDYATDAHKCGTSGGDYLSNKQSNMLDDQWDKLAGFGAVDSTPILGSDAVEIPLSGLPVGEFLVFAIESRAWDCGDGSEHDGGGRRLRATTGRGLSSFTTSAGSSATSGDTLSIVIVDSATGANTTVTATLPEAGSTLGVGAIIGIIIGVVVGIGALFMVASGKCSGVAAGGKKRRRNTEDDEVLDSEDDDDDDEQDRLVSVVPGSVRYANRTGGSRR